MFFLLIARRPPRTTRPDPRLPYTTLFRSRVIDHLAVLLRDGDVTERHAVHALDVVRREEVHVLVVLGELEGDVGDHDTERQRLDADLLVGVLALDRKSTRLNSSH